MQSQDRTVKEKEKNNFFNTLFVFNLIKLRLKCV